MYAFDVSAERTVSAAGSVPAESPGFFGLACICRDGETLVAFSHRNSTFLHLSLKPLAHVELTDTYQIIFRREHLLVADWNSVIKSHAIVSFRASGGALSEKKELLAANDSVLVFVWALTGDRLVLWDSISGDLLVYTFA